MAPSSTARVDHDRKELVYERPFLQGNVFKSKSFFLIFIFKLNYFLLKVKRLCTMSISVCSLSAVSLLAIPVLMCNSKQTKSIINKNTMNKILKRALKIFFFTVCNLWGKAWVRFLGRSNLQIMLQKLSRLQGNGLTSWAKSCTMNS